jgi:hypothetical protein
MIEHEIKIPKLSEWHCELFGAGPEGIILRPAKGNEPNFFWRWMQFVFFGNKWVRK